MSFVSTTPEAMDYASGKLEGIGTSLAAQNAAAAGSTASVQPAAADEVSALQAAQFSAYGQLYQQVSDQATAINQSFVQMLGLSGASYGTTEAGNSAATGTGGLGGFSLLGQLTQFGQFGLLPGAMSDGSMDGLYAGTPFLGSASTFAGLMPPAASAGSAAAGTTSSTTGDAGELVLANAATPPTVAAAPVLTGVGQAAPIGGLSVPPSWAGGASTPAVVTPATTAGWTSPALHPDAPVTNTVPGGVPSMASAGKATGPGRPLNGIKPRVMPRPTVV